MIALTGTVSDPKNDEKGLSRFGIVWLHLLQYKKGVVRPMLPIPLHILWYVINNISNIVDHREY